MNFGKIFSTIARLFSKAKRIQHQAEKLGITPEALIEAERRAEQLLKKARK
jgi:hypothetical protein